MELLLVPIGLACMAAAVIHGYLGQTKLIAPATFNGRQAQAMVAMIWQYSTVTWIAIGATIAASPWLFSASQRPIVVPLLCLPIMYGVVGNFVVSRGRHFGWAIFALILSAACAVVWI